MAVSEVPGQHHEDRVLLLLTLIIGALVGLVVVAFIVVTENLGARLYPAGGAAWRRLVIPIAGSLAAGILLVRYFPDARGSGIPQTKAAMFLRDGYISLRTVIGKFLMCSITLASGLALGREGPSVQIGAGLASALGRRLGLSPRGVRALLPIGASAAIAAAFNTPIAAVLFTLEEVMGDLHAPVLGSVVLSSATSWTVLHLLLGDEPLFHVPAYQLVHPVEFVAYGVLGLIGGVVSTAFVRLLLGLRLRFLALPPSTRWMQPAAGGLLVGALGCFIPGVLGVGYSFVGQALNNKMVITTMVMLLLLKIVATATCYSSGNAGGIFGPSLFMGAMMGGAFGGIIHLLLPDYTGSVGAYALVGMGAAFAGIIRVPLTSVIMIFEVTRDYTIIVPLMIANLISYFLASRLQPEPIYESLQHQDGVHLPTAPRDLEDPLTVADALRPSATDTLPDGSLPHVYPDYTLDTALRRLAASGQDELPVISRTTPRRLLGTISAADAVAAYRIRETVTAPAVTTAPRLPHRLYLGAFAALAGLALLLAVVNYSYRSERADRAERAFQAAGDLMSRGRVDEAIASYRQALSVSHKLTHRLGLGLALVRVGRPTESLLYLEEVLREDPANGPGQLGVAQALLQEHRLDEAVPHFRLAATARWSAPDRLRARIDLADALLRNGRVADGQTELRALAAAPVDDRAAAKQIGRMLLDHALAPEAADLYRRLLAADRQDTSALEGLADALFATRDYEGARTQYRAALALDPADTRVSARLDTIDRIIALDPALGGLNAWQRYQRSLALLAGVRAELSRCTGAPFAPDPPGRRRADDVLSEAQRLWHTRPANCTPPDDDPVALILASPAAP